MRPPNFSPDAIPETSFTCEDKITGGYYADLEADCQLFHVCVQVSEYEVRRLYLVLYQYDRLCICYVYSTYGERELNNRKQGLNIKQQIKSQLLVHADNYVKWAQRVMTKENFQASSFYNKQNNSFKLQTFVMMHYCIRGGMYMR